MTKQNIFTAAQTLEKETWVYYANDNGFQKFIKNNLEHQLSERIFQECQTGEKIVTVGEPYTHEILPLQQIEMREDVRVTELVRCKDCKSGRPYKHTNAYVACEVDVEPIDRDKDFFCAYGKRREE